MKGPKLGIDSLKSGDILFLEDLGEATHLGIGFAQATLSHHQNASANVTHVGMFDKEEYSICEASGAAGLRRMALGRKHPGYKFQVFRFKGLHKKIPGKAIAIANELILAKIQHQFTEKDVSTYSMKGADNYDKNGCFIGGSIKNSSYGDGAQDALGYMHDKYREGNLTEFRFYCSNFVVACYQLAEMEVRGCGVQFIKYLRVDYRNISPKTLQGAIRSDEDSFEYQGNYFTDPEDSSALPEYGTNLWTPYTFEHQTHHWSKRPAILTQIRFQLENYHGIPCKESTAPIRRQLLRLLGRTTRTALEDDINADRKKGLDELLKQVNMELWDMRF